MTIQSVDHNVDLIGLSTSISSNLSRDHHHGTILQSTQCSLKPASGARNWQSRECVYQCPDFHILRQSLHRRCSRRNVSQRLVAMSDGESPFHEAGVYNIATGSLYATSNYNASDPKSRINVTQIAVGKDDAIAELQFPNISMANGATACYPLGSPMNSSTNQ